MDCCQYGEWGAGGWDAPPAPAHYAHDPYAAAAAAAAARHAAYRYDYAQHHGPAIPMDYGAYGSKDYRVRRGAARRDGRARLPLHHLPIPSTVPDGAPGGRGFCDPQTWHHYQMGFMNGGGWGHPAAVWGARPPAREPLRYLSDYRNMRVPQPPPTPQYAGGRCAPYAPAYEEAYVERRGPEPEPAPRAEPRPPPPPPPVPLPAFQQAFGSTEIGKFAEAFSRAEPAEDDAFAYDPFDWEAPEPQWAQREIKCEDTF